MTSCLGEAEKDSQDSDCLLRIEKEPGGFCKLVFESGSQVGCLRHWTREGAQVPRQVGQDAYALGAVRGGALMPG